MMTITIWSDFACPYCYIGEKRLEQAIDRMGLKDDVRIDYRAFELDPHASREVTSTTPERFAKKYRLSLEDARRQVDQISALGREAGIDFRYATTRYSNTFDAHRLMKLAEERYDRAMVERLNQLLFDAYFTRNLVLAEREVLMAVAREAGMNETEVAEVLDSDRYADEVRLDEREAQMRGVRGVPYMVFNDEFAIPGAMSVEGFRDALERARRRMDEAAAKADASEQAHVCGPDGCRLV